MIIIILLAVLVLLNTGTEWCSNCVLHFRSGDQKVVWRTWRNAESDIWSMVV